MSCYTVMLSSEKYGGSTVFLDCQSQEDAENLVKALTENLVGDRYDDISVCGPKCNRYWALTDNGWVNVY